MQDLVTKYEIAWKQILEKVIHFQVLSWHSTEKHVSNFFCFSFFLLSHVSIHAAEEENNNTHYTEHKTCSALREKNKSVLISNPTDIIYSSIMKTLYRHDIRHKSQENYYRLTYSQFAACNKK